LTRSIISEHIFAYSPNFAFMQTLVNLNTKIKHNFINNTSNFVYKY